MSMRKTIYEILTGSAALVELVEGRIFERGSVVDVPPRPFLVQAWGSTLVTNGRHSVRLLELYAHDDRGDYNRIEEILAEAKAALQAVRQYVGTTGYRVVQCDYGGKSADLDDPDRRTGFQFSSWQVVGGTEQ